MTEELFIIKDNKRHKIELNVPSGITLQFQSPMLYDLSKFDCSRSFTFNIPFTINNSRLFESLEDIRTDSKFGTKHKVEYYVDGVCIVHDGNLYVKSVNGFYESVMTWNVFESLKKLQSSDKTINELYSDDANSIRTPNELGQFVGVVKLLEQVEGDDHDDPDSPDYDGPDYDAPDYD